MRDMDDRKIDFSPLDPAADAARWERRVSSLVARAVAARRRPRTVSAQLAAWSRPVLAAAAAVAVCVGAASLFAPGARGTAQDSQDAAQADPSRAMVQWAVTGELPSTAELYATFGGDYGRSGH